MTDVLKDLLDHSLHFRHLLLIFRTKKCKLPSYLLSDSSKIVLAVHLHWYQLDKITYRWVIQFGLLTTANRFDVIEGKVITWQLKDMIFTIFIKNSIFLL